MIGALGLIESWWALLALPATVFIGFAFAGAGIAAVTYMRSWQDFDILNLAILPMFLFSATFFPLSTYPDWLEWVIRATPLYNGVELLRALTTGTVSSTQLVNVAYLAVLGIVGMCDRRPPRREAAADVDVHRKIWPLRRISEGMGSASVRLRLIEAVCCLGCGAEYAKPSGRGSLVASPGCPACGYVGWVPSRLPVTAASPRGRSDADRRLHLSSRSG